MPRQARLIVPGLPHHILQRGHSRSAVLNEDSDCQCYFGPALFGKSRYKVSPIGTCPNPLSETQSRRANNSLLLTGTISLLRTN